MVEPVPQVFEEGELDLISNQGNCFVKYGVLENKNWGTLVKKTDLKKTDFKCAHPKRQSRLSIRSDTL